MGSTGEIAALASNCYTADEIIGDKEYVWHSTVLLNDVTEV